MSKNNFDITRASKFQYWNSWFSNEILYRSVSSNSSSYFPTQCQGYVYREWITLEIGYHYFFSITQSHWSCRKKTFFHEYHISDISSYTDVLRMLDLRRDINWRTKSSSICQLSHLTFFYVSSRIYNGSISLLNTYYIPRIVRAPFLSSISIVKLTLFRDMSRVVRHVDESDSARRSRSTQTCQIPVIYEMYNLQEVMRYHTLSSYLDPQSLKSTRILIENCSVEKKSMITYLLWNLFVYLLFFDWSTNPTRLHYTFDIIPFLPREKIINRVWSVWHWLSSIIRRF